MVPGAAMVPPGVSVGVRVRARCAVRCTHQAPSSARIPATASVTADGMAHEGTPIVLPAAYAPPTSSSAPPAHVPSTVGSGTTGMAARNAPLEPMAPAPVIDPVPSSARTIAAASAGRSAGVLARQRSTSSASGAGISGRSMRGSRGASVMCDTSNRPGVFAEKTACPVSSSKAMAPKAYRSAR